METLFLIKTLSGEFHLVDSRSNLIGRFLTDQAAQHWCDQNNYKLHKKYTERKFK